MIEDSGYRLARRARKLLDRRRRGLERNGGLEQCAQAVEQAARDAMGADGRKTGTDAGGGGGVSSLDIAAVVELSPATRFRLACMPLTEDLRGCEIDPFGPAEQDWAPASVERAARLVEWLQETYAAYGDASAPVSDLMARLYTAARRVHKARGAAVRAISLDKRKAPLSWQTMGMADGIGNGLANGWRTGVDGMLRPVPGIEGAWMRADGMPSADTWMRAVKGAMDGDRPVYLLMHAASTLAKRFRAWDVRPPFFHKGGVRMILGDHRDAAGDAVWFDLRWEDGQEDGQEGRGLRISLTTSGCGSPYEAVLGDGRGGIMLRRMDGLSDELAVAVCGWLIRDTLDRSGRSGRRVRLFDDECVIDAEGSNHIVLKARPDGVHGKALLDGMRMRIRPTTAPEVVAEAVSAILRCRNDEGKGWLES